ncbi:MAG: hypothetical protein IJ696_09105 [Ruminococcus sp.]|nr:hypothetical protein [Ruminococcus sp.]
MKNDKELTELFDTLDVREFDELAGDIEIDSSALSADHSGKGQITMKKTIKKKTAAAVIALAASLSIVGAVGAYNAGVFGGADHDKAAKTVLGDDYQSSEGYIGQTQSDMEGHLKITNERVLSDGMNGLLIFTVEPLDDAGAVELESTVDVGLDNLSLMKNDGKYQPFTEFGDHRGTFDSDGCKIVYWSFGYEPTDEKLRATVDIDLTITGKHIVNGDGKNVSQLQFDVEPNVGIVDLTSKKGNKIHLSDIALTVESLENMKDREEVSTPGIVWKDMPIDENYYGEHKMIKLTYTDGSVKYISAGDILEGRSQYKAKEYGGEIVDQYYFKELPDTKGLVSAEINGEVFTVGQK